MSWNVNNNTCTDTISVERVLVLRTPGHLFRNKLIGMVNFSEHPISIRRSEASPLKSTQAANSHLMDIQREHHFNGVARDRFWRAP
jgi:hypothetical protein